MCSHTCDSQAYSARWWMANYLSKTPKRHVMWSNSKCIGLLDLGKLRFNYQSSEYNKNRTAKKTISKSTGKRQFTGQRKQLKESQHLKIIGHVVLNGLWLSYVFVCLVCTCSRVCVCVWWMRTYMEMFVIQLQSYMEWSIIHISLYSYLVSVGIVEGTPVTATNINNVNSLVYP